MFPNYALRPDIARSLINELPDLFYSRTQRILIVVDGSIALEPAPNNFGVGKIAKIIDDADFGFARTRVTLATREGVTAKLSLSEEERLTQATYTGFRFNQPEPGGSGLTINQFDQIWCFGIQPLIHNPQLGDDAAIDNPINNPTSPQETAALREWMDNTGGSVLAMGDHGLLGASMCRGIPRVRRMRKWSVADGVPTQVNSTRLDTNRPANAAQTYNAITNPTPAVMPFNNQSDTVPQQIEWVPERSFVRGLFVYKQPHPILCHPTLGPIDVMADHAHEGRCFDTHEITDPFDDFPTVDGKKPMPKTIAYGHTLPDPPYNHEKGDQPARRFPLISVYDGQEIGYGRVVVDSTWHHWFDLNIAQLEIENGDEWLKIKRYFINVAIWLAKPSWRARMLELHLVMVPFTYHYVQELDLRMETAQLGRSFIEYLQPILGPCWVKHLLFDIVVRIPLLVDLLRERFKPIPDPCLTCPPFELLEEYVYGQITRVALKRANRVSELINRQQRISLKEFELESLEKEVLEAAATGILEMIDRYQESLKNTDELLQKFERGVGQLGFKSSKI